MEGTRAPAQIESRVQEENISYLVPRDPSINSWSERVKLPAPSTKILLQLEEFENTMNDKIKVYLRLKPSASVVNPYTVLNSNTLETEAPKESVSYKNLSNGIGKLIHKFTFTSILDQDTTQSELFKKCAVKNLRKFLSGENYLLLAYGTTSAGKTYTMQGNVENPGVIPRALDFVFTALKDNVISLCKYVPFQYNKFVSITDEQLKKDLTQKNFILSLDLTRYQKYPDATLLTFQTNSSSGFSDGYENLTFKEMQTNLADTESFEIDSESYRYSVWISMIEIYNEQIYDLLEIPNEKGRRQKLAFKDDEYGNTFVKDLRYVNVSNGHEAFQILQFGRSNLHLAPTALNQQSSRSHVIFIITLAKFFDYDSTSQAIISRFSFCDLAGMERAKKTLNVKDRLVESKAINTSLSIFVKCLTTIKENQNCKEKKMIPYRESKLTKLFRDAVTGKEQFSLIVNVTTEPNLFDETLSVLKFSAIAQKIVPQNAFAKPNLVKAIRRSRFSRIVMNSINNRKTIIDWDASTVNDSKPKEEETSSFDSGVEELQNLVESLREQLAMEKKRCEQIEADVREELTSKFSEILKKQNENSQIRLESETERLQEMHEKKQRRLIRYYEITRKNKRPKLDDDMSDYKDEEIKIKELEKDVELLRTENEGLKEQLQELIGENNRLMSECSEFKFKLVEKDRMMDTLGRANSAKEKGGDALEKELKKQLDEANSKISHFKSLLDEAATDHKELEENNKYLRNENEILEQHLTECRETVADLRNENGELQKMLSHKTILIEKLEEADEKKKSEDRNFICMKEVELLRGQVRKTSEWLESAREECEGLKLKKLDLEKDIEMEKLKIADLQSKVLSLEDSNSRAAELEKQVEGLKEELEKLKGVEAKADILSKEKETFEEKCAELEKEVKSLQKEVKDQIANAKNQSELETLSKENENYQKEMLSLKKKISDLEDELKRQTEALQTTERESKIALESLRAKFEAVEYQNSVMKNLKDEAERQAYEVPQLHEEIKRLEKEIENREKDMASFNENRKALMNNYEKEVARLKEDNERLRKDVFFANEVIAKTMTPLKTDKAEISRLKESVKKKNEEINRLKAEMESVKKSFEESWKKPANSNPVRKLDLEESTSREDSPLLNLKKKSKDEEALKENTPEKITKQISNLSIQPSESKSTRKKIDLLDESIHPSTVKSTAKGRKKKENGKKKGTEAEAEAEKIIKSEKESLQTKKKSKCYKKLFIDNDFDGLTDLNMSPLELFRHRYVVDIMHLLQRCFQETSRLRPRK